MKNIIYTILLVTCFSNSFAQEFLGGMGFQAIGTSNQIGRTSIFGKDDSYKGYKTGFSIEAAGDGKFYRATSEFLIGMFAPKTKLNYSPSQISDMTILNWEACGKLISLGDKLSIGLGGGFLWKKDGLLFHEINNQGYEVHRDWGMGKSTYGDYFIGSGSYIVRQRIGLGPETQLGFSNSNGTVISRLGYKIYRYGTGGLSGLDFSTYLKVGEYNCLKFSISRETKWFENPEEYLDPNADSEYFDLYAQPNTTAPFPYLEKRVKVKTIEFSVAFLFGKFLTN